MTAPAGPAAPEAGRGPEGGQGDGGRLQIQATCVCLDGLGILLRGPSGAGKSDLALRLIDAGARLVADDLCELRRSGDHLLADLPAAVDPAFRGRIELRGIGILTLPYAGPTPLGLCVDLMPQAEPERLPEPAVACYLGLQIPLLILDPFQASAVARLRLVALAGPHTIMRAP
jgi:serine kinase of HPr protein (carbohydrate metabolism regulator)